MFPAGCYNQSVIGEKCMSTGNVFNTLQVARIGDNDKPGKDFVKMADEFIRKAIPVITDVFFLVSLSK